jgi:predicted transposase YdaD
MLNLKETDITQTRFYQEVFQIGRQDGRQEGRQEGQQIGQRIGRQEGEIEIVLRILNRRCGQLSIAQQAQIKALPIAAIESLAEALLDFKGMADLETWLDSMAKV